MSITNLTVHELTEKLDKNEIDIKDIVDAYVKNIEKKEKDVESFVTVLADEARKQAEEIQEKKKAGEIKFCRNPDWNKR